MTINTSVSGCFCFSFNFIVVVIIQTFKWLTKLVIWWFTLQGDADSALDRLWQKKKVEVRQQ